MDDLEHLLSDAKLVVGYLSRMGQLGASPLPSILFDIEDATAKSQPVAKQDVIDLTTELSDAVASIRPVTLIDLGSKWRPFGIVHQSPAKQFMFATVSVIIILLTGYCTQVYIRTNDALSGLVNVQKENPLDKSIRIFALYKTEPAASDSTASTKTGASNFQSEPFLQSYEELHGIDDELGTYAREAADLDSYAYRIPGWDWLSKAATVLTPHANLRAKDVRANQSAPADDGQIGDQLQAYSDPSTPAGPSGGSASPTASSPAAPVQDLSEDDARAYFLNDLGVTYIATMTSKNLGLENNTISGMISDLRGIVEIYGTLILPVLYGFLGTIVFEMRKMLNPLRPNTTSIRIVVRTFLGGLTGLIVAFLFKPLHANDGDGQFAGATVFLVAFLMGFSIDVFFTTLDGLVSVLSRSVAPKRV